MAQFGGDLMKFIQRFQTLQLQREASDELIKDLLIYVENVESGLRSENQKLIRELDDARLDLSDNLKSRRELQLRLQDAESRADYCMEMYRSRNQYIIVLIDGDGLFFRESFIGQGIEGGKKAANALRTAILSQCGEHADGIEVKAKICANLSGLAKAMKRDGSLQNENDLRDFFIGFSTGKASFDFVDVGYGKERADSKIQESARWNLRNYNCRQVVLGVSHDAGYAPFLDEILQDEQAKNSVTILEGFPTVRELLATGVNVVNFTDTLFRSRKLVDRIPQNVASPGGRTPVSPPSVFSTSTPSSVSAGQTPTPAQAPAPAPTPAPAAVPAAAPPPSYAGVTAKASPPPTIILPLAPKPTNTQNRPTKPPPWNPGPRGLDPPIQVNQAALDGIKKRKENKLCNNHYLRGPCAKGDSCCFEHHYKPTAEELKAIAFLARLNPCTNGQDCDIQDCIYGHHCPSTINGHCQHPKCKFRPDEHPTGTKYKPTYRNGD